MTKLLLSLHVLAAVIAVGPVTVAASMFPAAARHAHAADPEAPPLATVRVLHRICRVYTLVGVAVPVFGLATANTMGVLTDTWLIASMILTALAAVVLAALVLPRQESLLTRLATDTPTLERRTTARLAMATGAFNLLWATVTILMIVRPGSTTGA
ncbi:membrane protein [Streptomyces albiaxialis]|uniref:Membrane protein n=1 Tax=Streptomyces albiaxialis TaxID=329523 RepID=A0ABN2W446_9ACTN